MSRRNDGRNYGSSSSSNWQGSHNPNMAPLPPRPRGGIGSSNAPSYPHPSSSYGSPHAHTPISSYNDHSRSPLPDQPSSSSTPTSSAPEVATTLFVGSISPGISDGWLTKLLETCGPLRSLKRASPAFGFAEFSDPDSVLRAIAVLHGLSLPSMGSSAHSPPKNLLVKADGKTQKFLDQYERTRTALDSDHNRTNHARAAVKEIVRAMSDPNAPVEVDPSKPGYVVPDHLKDLPPEELPEDSRETVLGEIEQFRQAAAARDAETRRREAEFERQRVAERARREAATASTSRADPQSYRRPVDFHPASYDVKTDTAREPEDIDEMEEAARVERKKAASRSAAADAERSYSVRERQRLSHWEKVSDKQADEETRWQREGVGLLKKWEGWSDESATRKELFYTDRNRWRSFRASARRREEDADERDREKEAEEKVRAQEESEKFLAQQAEEMEKLTEQQRKAGVLVQGGKNGVAPIKLTFASSTVKADPAEGVGMAQPVLGEADDETSQRKGGRLTHIQLSSTLTPEEKAAKIASIQASLPSSTSDLFSLEPAWDWVNELIDSKYKLWADAEIEDSLGEKVPELVSVVVEGLEQRWGAKGLVEAVEPVSTLIHDSG